MHTLRLFMVYACAHAQTAGAFTTPLLQNPDYQERCRSSPSLLPVVVHRARIHTGTTSTSTGAPTQHHVRKSRLFLSLQLYASESNESEDSNDNDNSNADADSDSSTVDSSANTTLFDFYRDLRNAKNDKLGGTIPPEQLQRAAEDSTNDFLTAMKEVTEDFEAAKAEIGADAACDLLLTQIRQDEEEQEQQQQQQQQQGEQDNGSDNNSGFQ